MNMIFPNPIIIITLAAVIALPNSAYAAREINYQSSEYRIVGVTEQSFTGAVNYTLNGLNEWGISAANQFCVDAYGPLSRAARTVDAMNTPTLSAVLPRDARILPSNAAMTYDGTLFIAIDPHSSGQGYGTSIGNANKNLSCRHYYNGTPGFEGIIIFPDGMYGSGNCDIPKPIACAAPAFQQ